MNIYVDESGSFVNSEKLGSWNTVVGLVTAESGRKQIATSLRNLRADAGAIPGSEVKLGRISEAQLIRFLTGLDSSNVLVFAVATDASLNSLERVRHHQNLHVADTRSAISRMKFDGGKRALAHLADRVEALPAQLYVQLICQVGLFQDIISRSVNYFVQRHPSALHQFRWRIDQKNSDRPTFEETFERLAPALLQTRSIQDPMIMIKDFDYSAMNRYEFSDGRAPEYLQSEYGLPLMQGYDLQKVLRSNLKFVNSATEEGVQAADLIASTIRRLLRGNFDDCDVIANRLGRLMLQNQRGRLPIVLTSFAIDDVPLDKHVTRIIRVFEKECKALITERQYR